MDLEDINIVLSEINHMEKNKYYADFIHMWNIKIRQMNKQNKTNSQIQKTRLALTEGRGLGRIG